MLPVTPSMRRPAPNGVAAQNVEDAPRQRTAICGHRQHGRLLPFRHQSESFGIFQPVACQRNRDLVAAQLAFGADAPVQPPYGGMIEQQRLDQDLQKIHESIEPPDMGQFVRDHRPQLRLRQAGQRRDRQQDDGTKPADHRRRLKPVAFQIPDGAGQAELMLQFLAYGKNARAQERWIACGADVPEAESRRPSAN